MLCGLSGVFYIIFIDWEFRIFNVGFCKLVGILFNGRFFIFLFRVYLSRV